VLIGLLSPNISNSALISHRRYGVCCRHDKEGKGSLTFKQIWAGTETNRNIFDPTGWTAEKLEWVMTW
jgi:hypothetical protein